MRKRVGIFYLSPQDFDEYACKFMVLSMNRVQDFFEFEFPEIETANTTIPGNKVLEKDRLFKSFSEFIGTNKDLLQKDHYFVGITTAGISKEDELFWLTDADMAIITTQDWKKVFTPPSVLEYITHSIAGCVAKMAVNGTGKVLINEHNETRGCFLDYTGDKRDNRVDVSLGYICDDCRKIMTETIGEKFTKCVEAMCRRDWLGEPEKEGTVAHDLKKFFKVDLTKDTGFYKTFWEKAKDNFPDLPKDLVLVGVTAALTYFLTR